MRNLPDHTDLPSELLTSLLIKRIQIRVVAKLGWLIGLVEHAYGLIPFVFPVPAVTFNSQHRGVVQILQTLRDHNTSAGVMTQGSSLGQYAVPLGP
jgi:hypothetical protein